MSVAGRIFTGLFLACVWAVTVVAQPPHSGSPTPAKFADTVVVDVDVVNVYFNVWSNSGLVQGLNSQDFRVYEDGRPQEIRYFAAESQQPLTLALLVDSSSSQKNVLDKELDVGTRFLQQVLRPNDEALVVGFDSQVQIHQDFTGSPEELATALANALKGTTAQTELFDSANIPKARSTALYDAIAATAQKRMQQRTGHKAMIILTDGQDMGSRHPVLEAMEAAERSDTICYVLLIGDKREMASVGYHGVERMRELANATGGRLIMVGNAMEKLEPSFNEISAELRHYYNLGYTPDRRQKHGEYRKITLKSTHGYKVQARKGYYATVREKPVQESRE
jgi:VWFA-related protein